MANRISVAIIIPVHNQPKLIVEALHSALQQTILDQVTICVVCDGGTMKSQADLLNAFALTYPQVHVLWTPNGGPGRARNLAIEHCLDTYPTLEACFFLDSDNRLEPWAMEVALHHLRELDTDWLYSDFQHFGIKGHYSASGTYSPYLHLFDNYCDSGCLVNVRVLRADVRFNNEKEDGFEDWGFWLNAIRHGFKGTYIDDFGFRYRRRGASRFISESNREASNTQLLRRKNHDLYDFRYVKNLEIKYSPRFLIIPMGAEGGHLTSDPLHLGPLIGFAELKERFWRGYDRPDAHEFPAYICFTHPVLYEDDGARQVLRDMFMRMDFELRRHPTVTAHLRAPDGWWGVEPFQPDNDDTKSIVLFGLRSATAGEVLQNNVEGWLLSQVLSPSEGNHVRYSVYATGVREIEGDQLGIAAVGQLARFKSSMASQIGLRWNWKIPALSRRIDRFWTENLDEYALPELPDDNRPSIAFVMRVCDFGGAEKVIFCVAAEFQRAGWHVNLVVYGNNGGKSSFHHIKHFDNIYIINDAYNGSDLYEWGSPVFFHGEPIPTQDSVKSKNILNVLYGMDCVVNAHSWTLNRFVVDLKKRGIVTATYLHLVDHHPNGRPGGQPYVSLAFEFGYNLFISCSYALRDWLGANGVPDEKLVVVPNAPGFPLKSPAPVRRTGEGPLRVLYAGRLDRQKGIDRLLSLQRRSRDTVEWRIIGGSILENGDAALTNVLPPIYDEEELAKQYAWADVMVLLSDFEGVPLAILEAKRAGCVVIATAVGAVAEIIENQVDGFLVPTDDAVEAAWQILSRLDRDRRLTARIGSAAQASVRYGDWTHVSEMLIEQMSTLVAEQREARRGHLSHQPRAV